VRVLKGPDQRKSASRRHEFRFAAAIGRASTPRRRADREFATPRDALAALTPARRARGSYERVNFSTREPGWSPTCGEGY